MTRMEECKKCDFKFHTIRNLSAVIRMKRHMRTEHTIPCNICGKYFVSSSHKAVHKHLSHNLKCTYCGRTCEGYCSRYISAATEKVGGTLCLLHGCWFYQLQLNQVGNVIVLSFANNACVGDERVHPLVCVSKSLHVKPVKANRLPKQTELYCNQGTYR